jgi:subtilisin
MERDVTKALMFCFLWLALGVARIADAEDAERSYVVVLKPATANVRGVADDLARGYGGRVGFVYEHALKGFSIKASPLAATALASNPRVAYVEEDRPRSIHAQTVPTGIMRIFADTNTGIAINGTDQRVDVGVAVIDTGIDWEHPDLNVVGGTNCASGSPRRASCSGNGDDDHYHGTHVAGTIAALDNGFGVVGVAPGARLYAVKVLNAQGSGYLSWIIAGIDWVTHPDRGGDIAVANMSLGGSGYSQAEYDAIQGAVNKGVAFAVAAGNSNDDASKYSPAAFDNVLTVSALADFDGKPDGLGSKTCRTDEDDTLANFSNWGAAVNIAAPGVCIESTYPIERGSYGTISGTSMASPHVAGALALLASKARATNAGQVHALYDEVLAAGNLNWVDDAFVAGKPGDKHEPLLDVSKTTTFSPAWEVSGGSEPGNQPPVASFTWVCNGLKCSFTDVSTDTDGKVIGWGWEFGDGATNASQDPEHTYAAAGKYPVTLTVTDDDGSSASTSETVTVSDPEQPPPSAAMTLAVTAYKVRGLRYADLSWSGAAPSEPIDVWRDGVKITTVGSNADGQGAYTDSLGKGSGTSIYKVCSPADSDTCSNESVAVW